MTHNRIQLDRLPKGEASIERAVRKLRSMLESVVADQCGHVGVVHALAINSLCRHESIIRRWYRRQRDAELSFDQQISVDEIVSRELERRDAAYKRLGLPESSPSSSPKQSLTYAMAAATREAEAKGRHPSDVGRIGTQ